MDDPRLEKLRDLIAEVIDLQKSATKLLGEVKEQLHEATATADDRPERRKKPRQRSGST